MNHGNGRTCQCWSYRPDKCEVCKEVQAEWQGERQLGHDHYTNPIEETMMGMLARYEKLYQEFVSWRDNGNPGIAKAVREDIWGQNRAIQRAIRINPRLADMCPPELGGPGPLYFGA